MVGGGGGARGRGGGESYNVFTTAATTKNNITLSRLCVWIAFVVSTEGLRNYMYEKSFELCSIFLHFLYICYYLSKADN